MVSSDKKGKVTAKELIWLNHKLRTWETWWSPDRF